MPYGTRPLQAREVLILEDFRNKSHTLLAVKLTAVRRYNPGPLLPPPLKAMEPKICEVCCLIMTVYPEYSTHKYSYSPENPFEHPSVGTKPQGLPFLPPGPHRRGGPSRNLFSSLFGPP